VVKSGDSYVLIGADGDGDNVAGVGTGGRIAMVGDCLGINDRTVIWPHGTEIVAEDPLEIDVPGLGRVGLGDEVTGGAVVYADYLPDGIDAIPPTCPRERVIAFLVE